MMKIATHDSATGEKGKGLLSWLVTPFAKTQSKTIKEQYDAGCRMFDIRIKIADTEWRCAHGLWVSERTADSVLEEINAFTDQCYVLLTYEGTANDAWSFPSFACRVMRTYTHIVWGGIAIKYGKDSHLLKVQYDYIQPYPTNYPPNERAFLPLDGTSWHIILPIPWLWKKIYFNKVEFNEKVYKFVDFL